MTAAYWEHFEHDADIGIRGVGPTLEQAFEQIAVALTAVVTDPGLVSPETPVTLRCEARDREFLLVDWINELVYAMATRRMLFSRYRVKIDDGKLEATAYGEPVNRAKHSPSVEIKGATLTELLVGRESNRLWIVQCVVDV
ncbi:MAG: archease [Gammaproteobacteria bacterium]